MGALKASQVCPHGKPEGEITPTRMARSLSLGADPSSVPPPKPSWVGVVPLSLGQVSGCASHAGYIFGEIQAFLEVDSPQGMG